MHTNNVIDTLIIRSLLCGRKREELINVKIHHVGALLSQINFIQIKSIVVA